MRYKINNKIYCSENSARSHHQQQKDVLEFLKPFGKFEDVLDYGCGKLRYFFPLKNISNRLHLLDSKIQLTRLQKIHNHVNSIEKYVNRFKNVNITHIESMHYLKKRFDFILCSNVLSAIPEIKVRKNVLLNINKLLKRKGVALIVIQFKNSRFDHYHSLPDSIRINEGILFNAGGQTRYYAILTPLILTNLIKSAKLKIITSRIRNGRGLFLVSKSN